MLETINVHDQSLRLFVLVSRTCISNNITPGLQGLQEDLISRNIANLHSR